MPGVEVRFRWHEPPLSALAGNCTHGDRPRLLGKGLEGTYCEVLHLGGLEPPMHHMTTPKNAGDGWREPTARVPLVACGAAPLPGSVE